MSSQPPEVGDPNWGGPLNAYLAFLEEALAAAGTTPGPAGPAGAAGATGPAGAPGEAGPVIDWSEFHPAGGGFSRLDLFRSGVSVWAGGEFGTIDPGTVKSGPAGAFPAGYRPSRPVFIVLAAGTLTILPDGSYTAYAVGDGSGFDGETIPSSSWPTADPTP